MKKNLPRKAPRWQNLAKEKKQKRSLKFLRLLLSFICFILFTGLLFLFLQGIKSSLWNGQERVNFVIKSQPQALISFSNNEKNLIIIPILKGTKLEVTRGYGPYRVEAIPRLEELEKNPSLLSETVQENLGVPVLGWIKKDDGELGRKEKDEILNLVRNLIFGKGKTNFSHWDLIRLWWGMREVRAGEVKYLDFQKLNLFFEKESPDGVKYYEIDPSRIDPIMQKYLSESPLKEENLSLEILNGTNQQGLGERGARLLTNLGIPVVSVGNAKEKKEKCEVESTAERKNSLTVQKIIKIFKCNWSEKKEEGRAEITLTLGEDYWQRLNER